MSYSRATCLLFEYPQVLGPCSEGSRHGKYPSISAEEFAAESPLVSVSGPMLSKSCSLGLTGLHLTQ